jgi:hypothetical protein
MQTKWEYIVFCLISIFFAVHSIAQVSSHAAPWNEDFIRHGVPSQAHHTPSSPLSVPIPVPGTIPIGLDGMYQGQSANRGLHNILVDPSHVQNLHAAVTFPLNVTEADTVSGKNFLSQLRVYYLFSSDGGMTWSAPKPIIDVHATSPEMILMRRGADYVPVIAAVRNNADTNNPFSCALYIEQGKPGDGNFTEFLADRKTFRDSIRNIDNPSIALSGDSTKIFMTAGVDNSNAKNPGYIQFGTFALSEDRKSVTWGGWKQGPNHGARGAEDPLGFAFSFSTSVRVSPSGKIGVLWTNRDYGTPDLSTYLSESNDGGATWLATPKTVLTPLSTQQPASPDGHAYVLVTFNTDFWYAGEHAQCVMAGFYYNRDTGSGKGFYIPQSGTITFWNDTMSQAVLLLSKENDTPLGNSVLDGSWLAPWTNTAGGTDPQGLTNLYYPTVARTSDPNVFSIYFNAWQDGGDIEDMSSIGTIGNGMYTSYPYFGIWQTTTIDGGVNFTYPVMVHGNDLTNSSAQQYDYRQIETAPWIPSSPSGELNIHTLFNVDTSAGIIDYAGNPGYDEVTWLSESRQFSGVEQQASQKSLQILNYPNPVTTTTTFPLLLSDAAPVTLEITDMLGRNILRKNYGILGTGKQEIVFNAKSLECGSYGYRFIIGSNRSNGIFTVIR